MFESLVFVDNTLRRPSLPISLPIGFNTHHKLAGFDYLDCYLAIITLLLYG